ncbi:MAG: tetratricopeptide repeat protein [Candidatus Omnitrophica bacterium]|nr:tetratricopeptide repeat protein [Candidatus Omnitrophota bacterium]
MKKGIGLVLILIIITGIIGGIFWYQKIKTKGEREFYAAKKLYEEKRYDASYLAFDSLLKDYRQAIWSGEAIYYAGKNLSLLGRDSEAKEYWQRLKDQYGDSIHGEETNFYIGRSFEREGDVKKARPYYEKVVKKFPASSLVDDALLGLGRIYEKEGEVEDALASIEKVAANFRETREVARVILDIAALYEKKEEWVKSLDLYYKVCKDFPEGDLVQNAEDGISRINTHLIFSRYPTEDSFIYRVEKGDSLSSIAKKFNTTIELITESNGLKTTMLKPGQRLKILESKFSIKVSKGKNKVYLKNNDKLIKVYRVATGKDNLTPEGNFTIVNKLKDPPWYTPGAIIPPGSPENILGSRWIGISEEGYGFHGSNNPADIGKYVTNGCVRLREEDVKELYKLVPVGTPVEIIK